jgi:hypothetical protein
MNIRLPVFIHLAAVSMAFSQTAELSGIVRDPSQALVPRALVTILNEDTNAERTSSTNNDGEYTVAFVAPGWYTISVQAQGFRPARRSNLKLDVSEIARLDFVLELPAVGESVSVPASPALIQSESAAVSTVIDRQFIDTLPLNGRSFQTLIALTPGVVMTKASFGEQGQFSVNGQRANANYFTIDGIGANIGVSAGLTLVQSASGSLPGLGATGGTNTLVAVESMQEFRVQTSTYSPEYGRMPGAQVSIVTRSGTNQLHGSLFDFFRNDALDSRDWFANQQSLPKPRLRQNDFGGVVGGPVHRNTTFLFISYEGLRLLQPQVEVTDVPSIDSRQQAVRSMQPFLNSFPIPNRPPTRFGFAPFVATYTDRSSLDATSIRADQTIGQRATIFGRYNHAPSVTTARLFAINNPTDTISGTDTITAGATVLLSTRLTNDLRVNFSRTTGESYSRLDNFGGATPLDPSVLFPPYVNIKDAFGGFFIPSGLNSSYYLGKNVANAQRQYNIVDSLSFITGGHQLKFGVDWRRIGTYNGARSYDQFAYFTTPQSAAVGVASSVIVEAQDPGSILFRNLSLFAQDAWKVRPRLTLTYGARWEINPAPEGGAGHPLYTFQNYDHPRDLALAPLGTKFYEATWRNFAPRVGVAYQLRRTPRWETTLRGGWGLFYDLGSGLLGQAAASFPYYRVKSFYTTFYPLPPEAVMAPAFSLAPPVASIYGAVRGLKLPVTHEWNLAIEQSLGRNDVISVSYVGAAGRNLLRQDYFVNPNDNFTYAYLLRNTGFSNFDSLQVQYQHRLSKGLHAMAAYTWSHSLDNASNDSASYLSALQINPLQDYGPSDFDIRHALSAAFTYDLPRGPTAVLRNWALDGVVIARSATPIDVTYYRDLGFGLYNFRPDAIGGVPLYLADPNVPGGRRFNPDAFDFPNTFPGRQGTLGRNVLRGFNLNQLNFTVRREFPLVERLKLQFRAEMFNVLNHPNFADPTGALFSPEFGYSTRMLAQDLGRGGVNGGLNPLYQVGGPRSIQLALRVVF